MSNCAIVGINWGDEGKGRMVDLLTEDYDVVVRYQGGGNAGHNGLKDITEKLSTPNFWRLRLGTGHPRTLGLAQPVADFVLHAPSDEHKSLILECISAALKTSNDIACGDMARVQRAIAKYGTTKPQKEDAEEK